MLKRFSISLEEDLLETFDTSIGLRQYSNRSEAIRDLIRKSFVLEEWAADEEVIGVISLIYDHHQRQLQEKLTELQHDFYQQILSSTHIHVDHDNCLEVVIVRGRAQQVRELSDSISSQRGVKHANLSMSSTGQRLR